MKARIILTIILTGLILASPSCKKEEIDYTYEINSIQWADEGLDFDQDGYITSRTVMFNVNLLENAQRNIRIKVYYKLSETREYIFYNSYDQGTISGGGADTPVSIKLGLDPELKKGMYSFLFEVYEIDNPRKEASQEIENILFERLVSDQNYNLSASWDSHIDYDFDDFPRSANLNLDINITNDVDKEIKVEVLYKNDAIDMDYVSFFKSDYYMISGENEDQLIVPTGNDPDSLVQGTYSFKVIVMERNVFSPVLIYDLDLSDELKSIPFESEWEDIYHYKLNFENTKWVGEIDNDGDGYCQSRLLRLDMDIEKDETVNIKLKVFRRPVIRVVDEDPDNDDDYDLLDSTYYFPITGTSISDTILFNIGNFIEDSTVMMDSAEWEIMLGIYEVVPNDTIDFRFAIDSIDNTFFRNLKFELGDQDL